jgi:TetR/AcrR family transcriptional regulator, upper aerobic nicotinate degradation pathway regulator
MKHVVRKSKKPRTKKPPGGQLKGVNGRKNHNAVLTTTDKNLSTTKENILNAATLIFSKYGYEGASVQKISKAAKSVDRMIYYYFGNKEGLFIQVIESIYAKMNQAESAIKFNAFDPEIALNEVIGFVINYYRENPEFITLLNTENLMQGSHISKSPLTYQYSSPAINVIKKILIQGVKDGKFRNNVKAMDVYLLIVSTSYFYVSNRFTLTAFLGKDMQSKSAVRHWHRFVTDVVLRTVQVD